jgi:hypothetical protein
MEEADEDSLMVAVTGLMQTPHWEEFEQAVKDRHNAWLEDTTTPQVYQNHAELASTNARAAELRWFLQTFDTCRSLIKTR